MDRFGLLSLIIIGGTNMAMAGTVRSFPKEKAIVSNEMVCIIAIVAIFGSQYTKPSTISHLTFHHHRPHTCTGQVHTLLLRQSQRFL